MVKRPNELALEVLRDADFLVTVAQLEVCVFSRLIGETVDIKCVLMIVEVRGLNSEILIECRRRRSHL